MTDEDKEAIGVHLDETFKIFKTHVLLHRQDKIKEEDYDKVLNADVFTGDESKNLGLVDEYGDLEVKMRELYSDAEIVNFSKESALESFKRKMSKDSGDTFNILDNLKLLRPLKDL